MYFFGSVPAFGIGIVIHYPKKELCGKFCISPRTRHRPGFRRRRRQDYVGFRGSGVEGVRGLGFRGLGFRGLN